MTSASLRNAAQALLERIDTELSRPRETAETHLVGGIVKMGARLEALLRIALEIACAEQDRDVSDFLPRNKSLRRATAGQIAHALKRASVARDSGARLLGEDVRRSGRDSVLFRIIELRNVAAHEGDLDVADATEVLFALRVLLEQVIR
ncbi:MAG: hypothetical protein Tsb0020_27570 [Haliangiales bacterium]